MIWTNATNSDVESDLDEFEFEDGNANSDVS